MTGLRVRPAVLVGPVTAVLGVAAALESLGFAEGPSPPSLGALVAAAVVAPLAVVRLWPVTAAVLSTVACLSGLAMGTSPTVAGTAALALLVGTVGWDRPLPSPLLLVLPFAVYAVVPGVVERAVA
ncbi:hypothetical protein AB0H87_36420, partial [Asanoa sp. NPDC050611]